jgi:hypothetical protein
VLSAVDADRLVELAASSIFKWTGEEPDQGLYDYRCKSGFKIAADIACFDAHHLMPR